MSIYATLKKLGIPVRYSHFEEEQNAPFLVYIGDGQAGFLADDQVYESNNQYQVELYFKKKNEKLEKELERLLATDGYIFEKSEDIYIKSEGLYVIYYHI